MPAYGCLLQNEDFAEENQFLRQDSNPEAGGSRPPHLPISSSSFSMDQLGLIFFSRRYVTDFAIYLFTQHSSLSFS